MTEQQPEIQLIASLVVQRPDGRVLLVRYVAEDERWWLPGEDLEPYEHPDDRARATLERLGGLTATSFSLAFVESFRGRRGWHVVFHYLVAAEGDPDAEYPSSWFAADDLPRTMHGRWEREAVQRALGEAQEPAAR
jgi:ADP-ribose pyrophosphatase YjhB (NUDIX family)